VVILGQTTWA